jgi:hypothetical protein
VKVDTKFNFNDVLEDTITGFKGQVESIMLYAGGDISYGLQSKELYNCTPISVQYFNERRLRIADTETPSGFSPQNKKES